MRYFYHHKGEDDVYLTSTARRYGTLTLDLEKVTALQFSGNRIYIFLSDGAVLEHWSETIKDDYEQISTDMMELRPVVSD